MKLPSELGGRKVLSPPWPKARLRPLARAARNPRASAEMNSACALVLILFAVAVFGGRAVAIPEDPKTPDSPFGAPSPKAAPALARLTYLLGDWTVTSFERTKGGEFIANPAVSFFRARYLRDGLSLMAEFFEERTISATSFVKRIYQSDDEGKTWKQGNYYFRYTRVR